MLPHNAKITMGADIFNSSLLAKSLWFLFYYYLYYYRFLYNADAALYTIHSHQSLPPRNLQSKVPISYTHAHLLGPIQAGAR